jgi:hypothetical protein
MPCWGNRDPLITAAVTLRATLSTLLLTTLVMGPVAAADRDGDGLRDDFEKRFGVTSPTEADTDKDGVVDGAEDSDGDRLANHAEQRFGLDPRKADTDGDGRLDGAEDHDHDGRSNAKEQDQRPLPRITQPRLGYVKRDRSVMAKNCISPNGSSNVVSCLDGDASGDVRIVLMGDSHATMLADPLRRAARNAGWRVQTMLKGACLPLLGSMNTAQWDLDRGTSCRQWRAKAFARLQANPPDLLVVIANDNAVFVDARGRELPRASRPAIWRQGIVRISDRLPGATKLLVLGDVPDTRGNPIKCLKADRRDMSRCTTRRKPLGKRSIERAVRSVVTSRGHTFGTLYGKICPYDPCPVVQGTTLVWRSKGHLSATFARRLAPSVRRIVTAALD